MTESEAQTRKRLIDQKLLQVGWDVNDPTLVTKELDIWTGLPDGIREPQTPYQGHLFADYALLGKDGHPLAVVEAKRTSIDAEQGKEQALNYALKIKANNGKATPFVFYTNGYEINYWDNERYPPRKVSGFPSRDDLERIQFLRDNSKPLSSELINPSIAGRPYQLQAIRSVLEGVEKKKRRFLLVMATGTGKTRTCMGLLDVLMRTNWIQRILFLVDRVALRDQALEAFRDHLPNSPTWPKSGEKDFKGDRRIYVSTYPTMLNIIENEQCPLSTHFFDMIIADESHRSIYNVYKNIFDYFDTIQLGLTATPTNVIDHNTFELFECEDGIPTFAYSYEEAITNVPPYLTDFEVLKVRTKFQQEGINSETISEAEKQILTSEGKNLDEINFEGTELEKKVSNKGTNALIVREFMEESIKDENGVLPGKTIIFAMTQKHADRLVKIFDALYPEYKGNLARVLVSGRKGIHGKGGLLDQFKNNDMPRIAISVDMLDTGIDVLEIVNLVFAKPVFSYTKFWQMIGRGTRVLDPEKIRPWCKTKDKFLIMDCFENIEYFKMKPKGREIKTTKPLPVRLFESKLRKLEISQQIADEDIISKMIKSLRKDIEDLPQNSIIVLDNKEYLDKVEVVNYWAKIRKEEIEYLQKYITPIMKARSNADFKAMRFELDILELSTAHLAKDTERFEVLKEAVIEKIDQLPLTVNVVSKEKEIIDKALQPAYWYKITDDDLDFLIEKLAPLMKYIETKKGVKEKLNLKDLLAIKDYVEFGPEHERLSVEKYRHQLEDFILNLVESNPSLQKLKNGEEISDKEIDELADLLEKEYPHVTEYILREIYDNRRAKFVQFLKHILGVEELSTFTETVTKMFDQFIIEHNDYGERQIQFLLTLKTFVLQRGVVDKKDLIDPPFTQIHPQGVRGVFSASEIDEIISLMEKLK